MLLDLLQGGLANLVAYLAAHVLLCLLPAFAIAGAMTALIPKESITRFLGRGASKFVSYPAATIAASLLAVCSCTIVPLFAGIYRKGAGLGPAITFLFFAPASNIMALIYTGGLLGLDLALARLFLSLLFGIGIGLIMAAIFRQEDAERDKATSSMFAAQNAGGMRWGALLFLGFWLVLLLAGTLKFAWLQSVYAEWRLPWLGAQGLQALLDRLAPIDVSKGQEGVSVQGLGLILMLAGIGWTAWKGLERIHEGATRWTWVALSLAALTLLGASLSVQVDPTGLAIGITGKFIGVLVSLLALVWIGKCHLTEDDLRDWLWETWRFVKQIFPLLIVGVFVVGILRGLVRPEWIRSLAGENTISANLVGVAFGVFMYFPTLVEVPIAQMFLGLGMHRGPLLAYLMADPELSLQSILIVSSIIGRVKAWTYVAWVALFSTLAGFLYGLWIDGFMG